MPEQSLRQTAEPPGDKAAAASARLLVFMFTDLVDSAALARQLGDADYVRHVLEPHNAIFRRLLGQFAEAREVKHTGDGFMATFASASDAAQCALRFHHELRTATWQRVTPQTRVGIHLGEAIDFADRDGTRADLAGDAPNMTARVMNLGDAGQTLLTKAAFDSARQSGRVLAPGGAGPGEEGTLQLSWLDHGRYRLKGAADPFDVCEVGVVGEAPLKAPADSDKGKRLVTEEEAAVLGWRPAPGLEIPRREQWFVAEKLGEGGFGEVWLARHHRTKEQRVFKFCFDSDRLRSFKRELTFFRLIQQHLGDRDDIARLYEVQMDQPPFFLESEYVAGGNLKQWSDRRGGIGTTPIEFRLQLLAGIARAVAAAHSLGIIHKDLKPSNILIAEPPGAADMASARPRLCDFGIGVLADRTLLQQHQITETGFTETLLAGNDSSRTGTRLYAPPESHLGKPATTGGDVYALGVMLYQLVTGDLSRPLGTGWEEDVSDELLREDILSCTHRDTARRPSATDLVQRLEDLGKRRANRQALADAAQREQRMRRLRAVALSSVCAAVVLGALGVFNYVQWKNLQFANARVVEEQKQTKDALKESERQRLRSAYLAMARGVDLCQASDVESGMLWMTRGLEIAPAGATDLHWTLRTQLACSYQALDWKIDDAAARRVLSPIVFSPDASRIVVCGKAARQWDTASGQPTGPLLQHSTPIWAMAFSPDGKRVLTAGGQANSARKGEACLWDADSGELIRSFFHGKGEDIVRAVGFSQDGKQFFTCGQNITNFVRAQLWDAATCNPIGPAIPLADEPVLPGPFFLDPIPTGAPGLRGINQPMNGGCPAVIMSPDAKAVVTVGGGKINVFGCADGKLLRSAECEPDAVSAAFSSDGQMIATGGKKVDVRSLKTLKPVGPPFENQDIAQFLAFSPDGKSILTGSSRGVRLWNLATRESLLPALQETPVVHAVAFSPDGKRVHIARRRFVEAWDVATGQRVGGVSQDRWDPAAASLRVESTVDALAVSPDGKTLVTGGSDGMAKLRDARTLQALGPVFDHQQTVQCAAFSLDGKTVVTGSRDRTARLWAPATSLPASKPMEHQDKVSAVAFSPDGKFVATSDGKTARLWDAATSQSRRVLPHPDAVSALSFSKDGKTIWTGCHDGQVRQWDVSTGEVVGSPLRHQSWVNALAVSPDGKSLLTGSEDRTAQLWDAATGKPLGPPLRDADPIYSVGFSPDGRMVVTGRRWAALRFWESATGKPLGPVLGVFGPSPGIVEASVVPANKRGLLRGLDTIGHVAFNPDGETFVTSSLAGVDQGEVRVWKKPGPLQGTPQRLALWVQVVTGLELDEDGEVRVLPAQLWQARRRELDRLGGPPTFGRAANENP